MAAVFELDYCSVWPESSFKYSAVSTGTSKSLINGSLSSVVCLETGRHAYFVALIPPRNWLVPNLSIMSGAVSEFVIKLGLGLGSAFEMLTFGELEVVFIRYRFKFEVAACFDAADFAVAG